MGWLQSLPIPGALRIVIPAIYAVRMLDCRELPKQMDGPEIIVPTHSSRAACASRTAQSCRSAVALHAVRTRSGTGVSAADVSGAAAQSRCRGGWWPRARLSAMRPAHGTSRYSPSYLAGALGTLRGLSAPLPLLAL